MGSSKKMNEPPSATSQAGPIPAVRRGALKLMSAGDPVTVPSMDASEMLEKSIEALAIDHVNENLHRWNFFADQRGLDLGYTGKTYEVVSWKKGRSGSMNGDELRASFREHGYVGIVPALLMWLIEHRPFGTFYSTIPEDNAMHRWSNKQSSFVATLYLYRDATGSRLFALTPPHKCSPGEVYLAFRQV